ncbi:hypothetical protein [Arthrobacter pigmenti]
MLAQLASGLEAADAATVMATVTDDVTLRVAVHNQPFEGREVTTQILAAVLDGALHDVEVTETIWQSAGEPAAQTAVLMFTVQVAEHPGTADGLLLVRCDPHRDNRIFDITVFLRPLAALQALADDMGRRLGGPRPGDGA